MQQAGKAEHDATFPSFGLARGRPDIRHGLEFEGDDWADARDGGLSASDIADFLEGVASGARATGTAVDHTRLLALAGMVRAGTLDAEAGAASPSWLADPWMGADKMARPEALGLACQLASMTVDALSDLPDAPEDPHPLSTAAARQEALETLRAGVEDPIRDMSTLANAVAVHTGSAVRLEMAWAYVRACLGEHGSMYRLAFLLEQAAKPIAPDGIPGGWRESLLATADGWRRLSAAHAPVVSKSRVDALTRASDTVAKASFDLRLVDEWAAGARIALPRPTGRSAAASGPAMPVLDSVGDAESSYGKDASRRFRPLMSPMPLRGGGADPDTAYAAMRREFPWMDEANRALAEAAALCSRFGIGHFRSQPLLVVGQPGVGKTRWARRAAETLGLGMGYLALSGGTSAMSVTGVERGWGGGRPSFAANAILSSRTANPLLFIDELDKAADGNSGGGSALDALLPFIEAETAPRVFDNFLLGNLDLSEVFWVAAANGLEKLPGRLLGRFRIVHAGKPQARDFAIVMGGILDDYAATNRVSRELLPELGDSGRFEKIFVEGGCSPRTLKIAVQGEMAASIWSPPGPRAVA